jgi:hypothetical protein
LLQWQEIERELGNVDITDNARLLEHSIAYQGTPRSEENRELMFNVSIIL